MENWFPLDQGGDCNENCFKQTIAWQVKKQKKRRVFYSKKQSNDKCGSIAVMTQRVSSWGGSHFKEHAEQFCPDLQLLENI